MHYDLNSAEVLTRPSRKWVATSELGNYARDKNGLIMYDKNLAWAQALESTRKQFNFLRNESEEQNHE